MASSGATFVMVLGFLCVEGIFGQTLTATVPTTECSVPNAANGIYFYENQLMISGSTVLPDATITLLCNDGYVAVSTTSSRKQEFITSTCTDAGAWRPDASGHSCIKPTRLCPALAIPNGFITSGSTHVGATKRIRCNAGYGLSGKSYVTCQNSGQWTQPGTCTQISCASAPVPSVENGNVDAKGNASWGDMRSVNCNSGFYLDGFPLVKCQASGSWSQPNGQCKEISRPTDDLATLQQQQLINAATNGNLSQVQNLVRYAGKGGYLNINYRDSQLYICQSSVLLNSTALHRAVTCSNQQSLEITRLLIKAGADVNLKEAEFGMTPLHLAAKTGNTAVVKLLLDNAANIDTTDNNGATPLILACDTNGNYETVKVLLDHGVGNINAATDGGETAIMVAAYNKKDDIVQLLKERGVSQYSD